VAVIERAARPQQGMRARRALLAENRQLSMGVLDTRLRCDNCGARLPANAVAECPNCHSDLAQVGVYSELLEWGKVRRAGRTRSVWQGWVLGWGGLLPLGMSLGFFLRGDTPWPVYLWLVSASLIAGYFLGRWYWGAAEREYQAAV